MSTRLNEVCSGDQLMKTLARLKLDYSVSDLSLRDIVGK